MPFKWPYFMRFKPVKMQLLLHYLRSTINHIRKTISTRKKIDRLMELQNATTLHILTDEQYNALIGRISAEVMRCIEQDKLKESKYMTQKEAKQILRISATTFCAWHNKGKLHPVKVGGKNLYRKDEIQMILNERDRIL